MLVLLWVGRPCTAGWQLSNVSWLCCGGASGTLAGECRPYKSYKPHKTVIINPKSGLTGGLAAPAIAAGLGSAITLGGSTLGIAGAGAVGGTVASVFGTTAGAAVLGGSIGIAGGNLAGTKTVRRQSQGAPFP